MNRTADPDRLHSSLSRRGYGIFRTREIEPGEQTLHHHDFYEVSLIWSGTLHCRVEGRNYHLTNGDILLVAPGELHQQEQGSCERMVLWLDRAYLQQFQAYGFDPTACFDAQRSGQGNCLRFNDELTLRIGELLERCLRESSSEEFGAAMMADTNMLPAMILITRLYQRDAQGERRDRSGSLVNQVLEYINTH